MPLKKLVLKPGVNRENTRYTSEGGWYDSDKIRFRQGTPEKIGGWTRISTESFLGICRSLMVWSTLGGQQYTSVGTNVKMYVALGGEYYDITPLRATETLTDPFETTSGSSTVTVTDAATGYAEGDYVVFSGATAVGGLTIDGEYTIVTTGVGTYTIDAGTNASSSATGGGTVTAEYLISPGPEITVPLTGWGASTWGSGTWGVGDPGAEELRIWSQSNFGEDLVFGYRGSPLYYWDTSAGLSSRAVLVSSLSGAASVPVVQNQVLISDTSRFVFCFGCNDIGATDLDPMLIRWSDQEDITNWSPAPTNQSGSLRLSSGAEIITATQARQEILVWTNSSLYSLQYVGPDIVWSSQLLGSNISIASNKCTAYANGIAYWMGKDNFYAYDGRVQPLPCNVRKFIFNDINRDQYEQVFAGTNEGFHEIWWFYCSENSTVVDRYVIFNYLENIWYYGSLGRTAWVDTGLNDYPLAATYVNNLVEHENGVDDNSTATTQPIASYITSAEFDLEDGHTFAFIHRMLPDVSFDGSTAENPSINMTLLPLKNSGSGYQDPASEGGTNQATVARSATVPVEQFTGQVFVRVRGRQMSIKVESDGQGVQWQLGSPRLDMRSDGRR